jgi:hypothetical protein
MSNYLKAALVERRIIKKGNMRPAAGRRLEGRTGKVDRWV